jgi:hypothetical protein
MAGKIFLNYRRGDDPGFAQALFGRLEQAFPPEQLFMDVDNIDPGLDFVRVLNDQVAECDVLISVIGKGWIDAHDETGARRLENPADFVRIEIESALAQDKRVIPVLVGQAQMPRADQLPETLKPLATRNAVRLTHERFRSDTGALIVALQRALKIAEDARKAKADAAARAEAEQEREREEQAALEQAKALRELEEQARRDKEQARLTAVAGLSPEQIAKAEELANWEFIKDSSHAQDFRDHLARFAHGVCERMAWHKLEALAWAALGEAPDPVALASHLEEFPEGAHAELARTQLASAERAEMERATLRRDEVSHSESQGARARRVRSEVEREAKPKKDKLSKQPADDQLPASDSELETAQTSGAIGPKGEKRESEGSKRFGRGKILAAASSLVIFLVGLYFYFVEPICFDGICGTTWAYEDTLSQSRDLKFLPNHLVEWSDPSGMGSYRVASDTIKISLSYSDKNNFFVTDYCQGTIGPGAFMSGSGTNTGGKTWNWHANKK